MWITVRLAAEQYRPEAKKLTEKAPYARAQELCESQGGRPGLAVANSLYYMVSVDVKQH